MQILQKSSSYSASPSSFIQLRFVFSCTLVFLQDFQHLLCCTARWAIPPRCKMYLSSSNCRFAPALKPGCDGEIYSTGKWLFLFNQKILCCLSGTVPFFHCTFHQLYLIRNWLFYRNDVLVRLPFGQKIFLEKDLVMPWLQTFWAIYTFFCSLQQCNIQKFELLLKYYKTFLDLLRQTWSILFQTLPFTLQTCIHGGYQSGRSPVRFRPGHV